MDDEHKIIENDARIFMSNDRQNANLKLKEKAIKYMRYCIDKSLYVVRHERVSKIIHPDHNKKGMRIFSKRSSEMELWLTTEGELLEIAKDGSNIERHLCDVKTDEYVDETYGCNNFYTKLSELTSYYREKYNKDIEGWKSMVKKEQEEKAANP